MKNKLPRILPSSAILSLIIYTLWLTISILMLTRTFNLFTLLAVVGLHFLAYMLVSNLIKIEYDKYGETRIDRIKDIPYNVAEEMLKRKDKFSFIEYLFIPYWIESVMTKVTKYINENL